MSTQHTPAPWRITESFDATFVSAGHVDICQMCEGDKGEHDPDARLIAQAPKLLAALGNLLGVIEYLYETGDIRDSLRNDAELIADARAVIAQAAQS